MTCFTAIREAENNVIPTYKQKSALQEGRFCLKGEIDLLFVEPACDLKNRPLFFVTTNLSGRSRALLFAE